MSVTSFRPLTKSDVAEILGVSIRTIENLVKSQKMPAPGHVGGRALWHPEIFYSWLDKELRQVSSQEDFAVENRENTEGSDVPLSPNDMAILGLWPTSPTLKREASKAAQKSESVESSGQQGKARKSSASSGPKLSAAERMKGRQAKRLQWEEPSE